MRMQTERVGLLQMHKVTTTDSHAGSQALDDVRHRLVIFSWQFFSDGLKATSNSSVILGCGWSLCYFSGVAPETR